MAWCPFATRMELQPESDQQAAIDPTQFVLHSIAAPWNEYRIYEYWRDSTNLESHFGLDFDGSLGQFIGTETKADANYSANLRADGTGAVSIETASNLKHTDPWTDAQIQVLIRLGAWLHHEHGIPLRICRSWTDPGFGYHRLFAQWAKGGTDCPGDARVRQFHDVVFPGIVRTAQGQPQGPKPTPEVPTEPPKRRPKMALVSKTVPAVVGDDSATVFAAVPGLAWLNIAADYVPPGQKVSVRIDVADGAGAWIHVNELRLVGNGEVTAFEVPRSDRTRVVSVKRLSHPGARLDAALHYPEG